MKNETKIQNQNETKIQNQDVNEKTFSLSQLKGKAKFYDLSTAAYIMYLESHEEKIGVVYYSRFKENDEAPSGNTIGYYENLNFQTASIMCRDEEAPKYLKSLLITKNYEEAVVLINFRLEKYSKNNNVEINNIETSVVIEIMQSVAKLYEGAKLIKLND